MKTKQDRNLTRKRSGVHPCCQSNKIAKDSQCESKICCQAVELEASSIEDNSAVPLIAARCNDSNHAEAVDHASCSANELSPNTCSYLLETIFSPPLEPKEFQCQQLVYSRAVQDIENPAVPDLISDESDDSSSSSCDDKNCNSESFHVADGSAISLSAAEDLGSDGTLMSNSCLDYECIHPEMIFDATERCMILPFLEETAENNNFDYAGSVEDAMLNSDDGCLFLAIHQGKPSQQKLGYKSSYEDLDDTEYFDPQLFIGNSLEISEAVPSYLPILMPKQSRKRKPITLVLDLDETLVHSSLEHCPDADFTFPVFFNMKEHTVYVRRRPHLHTFLERVAEMFEVIIFTASQSMYAEQLLNILDPDQKIISERVYRDSCIFSEGSYMKDLTILGRDLAKVAIIDNSPQVFQLQVNNGIPIESWFDDPTDSELLSLLPFLETLASADDVRPIIAKRFGTQG
ncbi:uncharacterized protein LOC116248558 [Nymphaea colorata]|nr:uncharacterized protein LOC116248558 [Nymphaea colorata]XP_031477281.1 uncharacterized protein LOC116248558 [Nymphaea colorata]XP_031477282.1 uncharacterized protein LOC116248558 [Nymphaea colorata]XP_031477283.1 uncharacterized protein LOC116248558 [Nymphaea colorata]